MNLLENIDSPADVRKLARHQLTPLAYELRAYLLDCVSKTGGHLSSNLGTVELTVALHYVFNTPQDRIVWDVGHQTYSHKILTGRRDRMHTLRQIDGISGFPRRVESEYDTFGTAHSSTSISAALGMAQAAKIKGEHNHSIAVIGDGSMTAGMAFEAMNNAGVQEDINLLVILNDNDMSISPPVGALNRYLARLMSGQFYAAAKNVGKSMLPGPVLELAKRLGTRQGHGGAGHDVRAVRLQLHRPDRRPRPGLADPDAAEHQAAQGTAVPARRHQEGPGLQAGRGRAYPLPRHRQIQSGRRHQAGRRAGQADLHRGVRQLAVRHGRHRQAPGRRHAGDARRLGHGALRAAVPGPLFRRRHRRAARRHLRRRPGLRGFEAGRGDLFDLFATRLRPADS